MYFLKAVYFVYKNLLGIDNAAQFSKFLSNNSCQQQQDLAALKNILISEQQKQRGAIDTLDLVVKSEDKHLCLSRPEKNTA